jgi:hypothetical protein
LYVGCNSSLCLARERIEDVLEINEPGEVGWVGERGFVVFSTGSLGKAKLNRIQVMAACIQGEERMMRNGLTMARAGRVRLV